MKKINKTRYIQSILSAVVAALAAISLSCAQPDGSALDGGLGDKGSIVLTASTGLAATDGSAGSVQRTILPTEEPEFSRYEVVFSKVDDEGEPITGEDAATFEVTDETDPTLTPSLKEGSYFYDNLPAGTWTVTVTAYLEYPSLGLGNTEYKAAYGVSAPVDVTAGPTTPVTVNINPVPVEDEGVSDGIFTYKVSFPEDASGSLILKQADDVEFSDPYLEPGVTKHQEIPPGYYDLTISLTKGELSVGLWDKVHVYSGLESKAVFEFTDANFAETVYLAGTLETLPEGVTLSEGEITVYSDDGYTAVVPVVRKNVKENGEWTAGISVGNIPDGTLYIELKATGEDGKIYIGKGNTGAAVTKPGKQDIELGDKVEPASVTDLEAEAGDGKVILTWTDPKDEDLDHIDISWTPEGGTLGAITVEDGTKSRTITGLTNGTEYKFTVKAVDTAGNESSEVVSDPVNLPITGSVQWSTLQKAIDNAITAETDLYLDAVEISGSGTVDFKTANVTVNGKVSVTSGITFKTPLPAGTLTFGDKGSIELAYGARGYYGDSLFIGGTTAFPFTWDTTATDSKLTLKDKTAELTSGKVSAGNSASVAGDFKLVIPVGAELTVPNNASLTVDGELDVKGTITVAGAGKIEVYGKYSLSSTASDGNAGTVTVKAGGDLVNLRQTGFGNGTYVVDGGKVATVRGSAVEYFVGPASANPTGFVVNSGKLSFSYGDGSLIVSGDVNVANTFSLDLSNEKLSVAKGGKLTIPNDKILRLTNSAYTANNPNSILSFEGAEGDGDVAAAQVVVSGGLYLAKDGVNANFYKLDGTFNGSDGTGDDSVYGIVTKVSYEWAAKAGGEGKPGWKQASTATVVVGYSEPTDGNITYSLSSATLSWKTNNESTLTFTLSTGTTISSWELDGVTQTPNPTTNNNTVTLTLKARDYSVGDHAITVYGAKDGVTYTKRVTFTVEK
jgi:hypothetical protein